MRSDPIKTWHHLVENRDVKGLDALLADDAMFHSPVVHTPQVGKSITLRLRSPADIQVLQRPSWWTGRRLIKLLGVALLLLLVWRLDGLWRETKNRRRSEALLRDSEARFRRLQTAFTKRRVDWLLGHLKQRLFGTVPQDLQLAASVPRTEAFLKLAEGASQLDRQLARITPEKP